MQRSERAHWLYAGLFLLACALQAQEADLGISFDPAGVIPGADVHYQMNIWNFLDTAQNAVITDILPPYSTFKSAVPAPGWTCGATTVGGRAAVRCTTSSFATPPFSTTPKMSIDVATAPDIPIGTVLTNTAMISSDTPESNLSNNTDSTTDYTLVTDYVADLSAASLIGSASIPVGSFSSFVIVVKNLGPSGAFYTTFDDTLPPFVSFVSLNAPDWSCVSPPAGSSGTIHCDRLQFLPGTAPIQISVRADRAGQGTNRAVVGPSVEDFSRDDWVTIASVSAADPAAVPTLSSWGLGTLTISLLALALVRLRRGNQRKF